LGEFYDNYERAVQAYKFGPESRYHDYHENTKRYCKIGSQKVGKKYQLAQENVQRSSGQFQQV